MSPPNRSFHDDEENKSPQLAEFEALLQEYDYDFKRGEVVRGAVASIDDSGALVDIGAKMVAFLPNKEVGQNVRSAREALKVGETQEFIILSEEDEEGQLTLSLKRVQYAQNWKRLEELMEADEVVECQVSAVVKGGLLVEIFNLRGFIPSSHLRVKQTLDSLVGETLKAKIINLDKARNNIILSHRKLMSEQMAEQRRGLFANLNEGDLIEGEVVRLTDFGAFVDLGGVDGLLPLSQMSWRWVEHPSDVLKIGETIKVEVIGIDHDKQRVSLSIKGQHADPWGEVTKTLGLGDSVEGNVTRLKHFGAFVEVYPGVEALLPSRDLTDYEAANDTKIDVGMTIKTFIVKFSPEERRISLSFQPLDAQRGPEPPPQRNNEPEAAARD